MDLVYFARCRSPASTVRMAEAEAGTYRWFSADDLATDEVAEDIRVLGRRAITKMNSHE